MAVGTQRDFVRLAAAPSPTEQGKVAHTHTTIREHLESDPSLNKYAVHTYLQGSYHNSTNVSGDSDVDMGCRTDEAFFYDTRLLPSTPRYRNGFQIESLKASVDQSLQALGTGFTYQQYRRDVRLSLESEYDGVTDGNKAITIAANSTRLEADVVPCIEFRLYVPDASGEATFHKGIRFVTTQTREPVINFPDQHYENLKDKDQANGGKVKGCIRILKRLRNELEDKGKWDRKRSPSFYLESFVWNAPDKSFEGRYEDVVQNVLLWQYGALKDAKSRGQQPSQFQANSIFPLYGEFFGQKFWNADDAMDFIVAIWGATFPS